MLFGCVLPLVFIFIAPAIGINGDVSLFVFIVAMFACHLLMPMHHSGHNHDTNEDNSNSIKHTNH